MLARGIRGAFGRRAAAAAGHRAGRGARRRAWPASMTTCGGGAAAEARRAGWLGRSRTANPVASQRGAPARGPGRRQRGGGPRGGGPCAQTGSFRPSVAADAMQAAGRPREAAEALRGEAAASSDPPRAAALLERALALAPCRADVPRAHRPDHGPGRAGPLRPRPGQALAAARGLASSAAEVAEMHEREAWLQARRGDLAAARAALEQGLAAVDRATRPAGCLRARLGRLLVTTGLHREAQATVGVRCWRPELAAGRADSWPPRPACSPRLTWASARPRPLAWRRPGRNWARPAALYLAGLLAQLAGDSRAARDAYRDRVRARSGGR